MELSVMICDDLKEERSLLRRLAQDYGRERDCRLHLEEAAGGSELLSRWRPDRWDLVLMDIYMPGLSGLETVRRLRDMGDRCAIALVTYSDAHGLDGYELGILDYLIKPVTRETMFDMLDWCVYQQRERLRTLTVRSEWEEMEVRLRDIRYIEIRRHTAHINLGNKIVQTRRGMAGLEEEVGSASFLRCHRSFLVNLAHVASVQNNDFVMDNGHRVPISAARAAACKRTLAEWIVKQG